MRTYVQSNLQISTIVCKCIDREGVVGSDQQYQQDVPEELDDVPEEEVQVSGPPNGPFPARVPRPTAKGGQCMCVIFVS